MPESSQSRSLPTLAFAALGVVFGDIGTSPLYTLKTVLALTGDAPSANTIMGVLSLIIWTLIIVTSLKYVTVAMRVDNDGEGGILALMSLLGVKQANRPMIVAIGLFGAALIYGDGALTPAISVLSALEGLNIVWPGFQPWVLPAAVAILVLLFVVQPQGTERIGQAFGPVMTLWFLVMGVQGIWGISRHPAVLWGLMPQHGLHYLLTSGGSGFLVLGGVFLCVTGAEALYADMGHFERRPITLAWNGLVFPSLVLNYAGQAALVLNGEPISDNIFYRLCPPVLLIPLVILATLATIIASQAVITGAFSMTRQAIQLGWLPRLRITQTSASGYGQIYVGAVNWLLMIVTLGLAIGFGKSDNLASAYGIAVSATMLMTTFLLFIAMREIWHWNIALAGLVAGLFMVVDLSFFTANLTKILDGGYVPILLAVLIYSLMFVWHRGAFAISCRLREAVMPIEEFLARANAVPRVPGSAVFLTRAVTDAPPVMVWHLQQNRALHERLLAVVVRPVPVPWVAEADRIAIEEVAPKFWRISARYGFMERPDLPVLLTQAKVDGCDIDLTDVTYYVGHETIIPREDAGGEPRWLVAMFATMQRNALHVSDYLKLPPDGVVEIGRQVSI
jgi:KUP system potassium uptake protein